MWCDIVPCIYPAVCVCVCVLRPQAGEWLGGYLANSLAVMSDAAHLLSDFGSFLLSMFAIWLSLRRPTRGCTFGYYRAGQSDPPRTVAERRLLFACSLALPYLITLPYLILVCRRLGQWSVFSPRHDRVSQICNDYWDCLARGEDLAHTISTSCNII